MRTDFETLEDGQRVKLFPNADNPIHKKPVAATFASGYFHCDGSNPMDGPDYYFGDVLRYNSGFELLQEHPQMQGWPRAVTICVLAICFTICIVITNWPH